MIQAHKIAKHLSISDAELLEFLRHFKMIIGRLHGELATTAREAMVAAGLRHDVDALRKGVDMVREWITSGQDRVQPIAQVRANVAALNLQKQTPLGSLVIHAIDRDPLADTSATVLDWVEEFVGDEPRQRREVRDPALWASFRAELRSAADNLRRQGHSTILVSGYARLPTWFTAGAELGRTSGFSVVTFQGASMWMSSVTPTAVPVHICSDTVIGEGSDLAIGIAVAGDPMADVLPFLRASAPQVGRYLSVSPTCGPSNIVIPDAASALGCSFALRDRIRDVVRQYHPVTLHLFLCAPKGVALLLGHLWDRMPATQLYEDLGLRGYCPSYLIPN